MPTYTFYNEVEHYEYEEFMAMSELDEYKKNNPNIRQVFTPIAIAGDHIMGVGPKQIVDLMKICKEFLQPILAAL